MIAHTLVDFAANVLPKLFSWGSGRVRLPTGLAVPARLLGLVVAGWVRLGWVAGECGELVQVAFRGDVIGSRRSTLFFLFSLVAALRLLALLLLAGAFLLAFRKR
jgi:hypothetical protein